MKQLLHCCSHEGKADYVVVALHDRAFLAVVGGCKGKNEVRVIELLLNDNDNCNTQQQQQQQQQQEEAGNNHDNKQAQAAENPIQAVAVEYEQDDNRHDIVWCAVSRLNKSLQLYKIDVDDIDIYKYPKFSNHPLLRVPPILHHSLVKRSGCLCFARIPHRHPNVSPSDDDSNTRNNNNNNEKKGQLVVLAGDLTGDAWALSVDNNHKEKRLLLGHTASMLTGIAVVNNGTRIVTADRDEKVRISQFPETTVIQGFLLGHKAYISAMDVVDPITWSDGLLEGKYAPRCVTCSGGDGSVRLWNYETMQFLAKWSLEEEEEEENSNKKEGRPKDDNKGNQTTNGGQTNGGDSDNKQDEEGNNNNSISTSNHNTPSRVAIHPTGRWIALICDQSTTLRLLQVVEEKKKSKSPEAENTVTTKLELVHTFECPHPPLSVSFMGTAHLLVLMKDPSYLQSYELHALDEAANEITTECGFQFSILHKIASSIPIKMPDSVLEKDQHGMTTLSKVNETRGGAETQPWNKVERVEIAKERNRRHNNRVKKRRKEEKKHS